jgi:hypothetical protein
MSIAGKLNVNVDIKYRHKTRNPLYVRNLNHMSGTSWDSFKKTSY